MQVDYELPKDIRGLLFDIKVTANFTCTYSCKIKISLANIKRDFRSFISLWRTMTFFSRFYLSLRSRVEVLVCS